ncbi:hypothetical protein [Rhodanobacter umsongensis]
MAKKPTLAELITDPFLRTLEGRDDAQMLTRYQACGFLNKAPATLDAWRKQNLRPPQWINSSNPGQKPDIAYPLGELRLWVKQKLEEASRPASPSALNMDGEYQSLGPSQMNAAQRAEYGLDEEILRGAARLGVKHANFQQLLARGAPTDEWVFLMVPTDFRGTQHLRPVDLISSLDMPFELVSKATSCDQISLATYLQRLKTYMDIFGSQEMAERRADRAGELPERDPDAFPGRGGRPHS